MAQRIKFDVDPGLVKPKLEDLDIETVDFSDIVTQRDGDFPGVDPTFITRESREESSPQQKEGKGYFWHGFSLNLSLADSEASTEKIKGFLEELDRIQKTLLFIVKIGRILTSDLKSIARALKYTVKQITKAIKELIDSFSSTGIYMTPIWPTIDERDSNFIFPINGGFQEFISIVNERCSDRTSSNAPRFQETDAVGGFIIGMIGGVNDPQFLEDMVANFQTLGKLFPVTPPLPAPPKNFEAIPGLYDDGTGSKRLGVKLTWDAPPSPITGFNLYRSKSPKGQKVQVAKDGKILEVEIFQDDDFNGGGPVDISTIPLKPKYQYIDFEVQDNNTYFYKVYSTVGYRYLKQKFFKRVQAPNSSNVVSAKPRRAIPLSELKKRLTLDTEGQPVNPDEYKGPWLMFSVRSLLGNTIDNLFVLLDKLAAKMEGYIDTSSDHVNKYIKFLEKKINFYMNIVDKIQGIIERLLEYRLRGSFLVLELPPEEGGMEGFLRRFNNASQSGMIQETNISGSQTLPEGISRYTEQGLMAGLVVVYGFPSPDGEYIKEFVSDTKIKEYTADLEKTKRAIKAFMKLTGLNSDSGIEKEFR